MARSTLGPDSSSTSVSAGTAKGLIIVDELRLGPAGADREEPHGTSQLERERRFLQDGRWKGIAVVRPSIWNSSSACAAR